MRIFNALYIKFLWHSKNQHAVHSPFVYLLITKCFYNKVSYDAYSELKKQNSANHKSKLLLRITNYFKPKNILVVQAQTTQNSKALQLGNPTANIHRISSETETLPNTFQNIESIETASNKTPFDFVYFDAELKKETLHNYFDPLLSSIHNDSIFIFNNPHQSKESLKIWETLKKHKKITVSIDTFVFGLLFFRREQEKEDFIIRV